MQDSYASGTPIVTCRHSDEGHRRSRALDGDGIRAVLNQVKPRSGLTMDKNEAYVMQNVVERLPLER